MTLKLNVSLVYTNRRAWKCYYLSFDFHVHYQSSRSFGPDRPQYGAEVLKGWSSVVKGEQLSKVSLDLVRRSVSIRQRSYWWYEDGKVNLTTGVLERWFSVSDCSTPGVLLSRFSVIDFQNSQSTCRMIECTSHITPVVYAPAPRVNAY